jgi:hypothetical protein
MLDASYITLCSLLSLLVLIPYNLYFFRNSLTFNVKIKSKISKMRLLYSSIFLLKWPVHLFLDICVTAMAGKRSTCMASYVLVQVCLPCLTPQASGSMWF